MKRNTEKGTITTVLHTSGYRIPNEALLCKSLALDPGEKDRVNARLARALVGTTRLYADVRE